MASPVCNTRECHQFAQNAARSRPFSDKKINFGPVALPPNNIYVAIFTALIRARTDVARVSKLNKKKTVNKFQHTLSLGEQWSAKRLEIRFRVKLSSAQSLSTTHAEKPKAVK